MSYKDSKLIILLCIEFAVLAAAYWLAQIAKAVRRIAYDYSAMVDALGVLDA